MTVLADLVGTSVTYTPDHGSTHHGVITSATYNTIGEAVVILHRDDEPVTLSGVDVLLGRAADEVLHQAEQHLKKALADAELADAPAHSLSLREEADTNQSRPLVGARSES